MFELDVNRYHRAESLVGGVPFNNLFARVVLENKVRGRVLVDDKDSPSVCLVVHKYGMALLCGTPTNESFYRELGGFLRNDALNDGTARWILCHPSDWDLTFARLLGRDLVDATGPVDEDVPQADGLEHVVRIERVNFQFNTNQRPGQAEPPSGFVLKRINASLFDRITGSVVPQAFWNDGMDFLTSGIGFSLLMSDDVVCTAFSSFVVGDKLELGVETRPKFRRRGLSIYPVTALIEYCVSHGYEPVWACRRGNVASFKLALKLGFSPSTYHPYYVLPHRRGRQAEDTDGGTSRASH